MFLLYQKFAYNSKTKFKDRYRWFRNEMKKKEIYNFINEANISKLLFKFKSCILVLEVQIAINDSING